MCLKNEKHVMFEKCKLNVKSYTPLINVAFAAVSHSACSHQNILQLRHRMGPISTSYRFPTNLFLKRSYTTKEIYSLTLYVCLVLSYKPPQFSYTVPNQPKARKMHRNLCEALPCSYGEYFEVGQRSTRKENVWMCCNIYWSLGHSVNIYSR